MKTEDVTLEDSDVELETVMVTPSRRPLMGIVWIVLIASLTAGGLFWTIPSMPSVVESTPEEVEDVFIEPVKLQPVGIPSVQPVSETAVIEDSTELIGDSNEVVEAIVTNPEPEPVVVQRTRQQSTPKTNVITEPKEPKESDTQASEPKVSEPQALKREVVQSEKPASQNIAKDVATPTQPVETMVEEPIEPVEPVEAVTPEEVEPEPPANGIVKSIGDAAVLRLKKMVKSSVEEGNTLLVSMTYTLLLRAFQSFNCKNLLWFPDRPTLLNAMLCLLHANINKG